MCHESSWHSGRNLQDLVPTGLFLLGTIHLKLAYRVHYALHCQPWAQHMSTLAWCCNPASSSAVPGSTSMYMAEDLNTCFVWYHKFWHLLRFLSNSTRPLNHNHNLHRAGAHASIHRQGPPAAQQIQHNIEDCSSHYPRRGRLGPSQGRWSKGIPDNLCVSLPAPAACMHFVGETTSLQLLPCTSRAVPINGGECAVNWAGDAVQVPCSF